MADGLIATQIQALMDAYNPDTVVLDAGPDFSTPQALIADNIYGQVFGCEYYRSVPDSYTNIVARPEDGIVKADRSATLTDCMKWHNSGYFHYPKGCEEVETIKEHLKVTKKLTRPGEMGDVVVFPKPDKPDHYAHALNYLRIADEIATDHDTLSSVVGVLPGVAIVRVGEDHLPSDGYPYA